MTESEWFDKFKPEVDAEGVVRRYETFGADLREILRQCNEMGRHRHVWTELENDDGDGFTIVPGYHLVNRMVYFVTAVPWTDDDEVNLTIPSE